MYHVLFRTVYLLKAFFKCLGQFSREQKSMLNENTIRSQILFTENYNQKNLNSLLSTSDNKHFSPK